MHIEFSKHYEPELNEIISRLSLDAHLFNSFNVEGETVTLSGEPLELEKIVQIDIAKFSNAGTAQETVNNIKKIIGIVREQLR